MTSSSSKSKTPSDDKKSSSSSSSKNHHHHKKDKKEKHKEKEKSHHKHHKSHKSSSKDKEKVKEKEREKDKDRSKDKVKEREKVREKEKGKEKVKEKVSNGKSSEKSGNGNIEIPLNINPNYNPPKVRQRFSDQSATSTPTKNGSFSNDKANIDVHNEDSLTAMIAKAKSGGNRTKVYSGRKTSAFSHDEKFPTLVQLCVHVLQDNVSLIDECGNAPYDLLKPILERGKPEDIMRIEDYNPRLIEDTGKVHLQILFI